MVKPIIPQQLINKLFKLKPIKQSRKGIDHNKIKKLYEGLENASESNKTIIKDYISANTVGTEPTIDIIKLSKGLQKDSNVKAKYKDFEIKGKRDGETPIVFEDVREFVTNERVSQSDAIKLHKGDRRNVDRAGIDNLYGFNSFQNKQIYKKVLGTTLQSGDNDKQLFIKKATKTSVAESDARLTERLKGRVNHITKIIKNKVLNSKEFTDAMFTKAGISRQNVADKAPEIANMIVKRIVRATNKRIDGTTKAKDPSYLDIINNKEVNWLLGDVDKLTNAPRRLDAKNALDKSYQLLTSFQSDEKILNKFIKKYTNRSKKLNKMFKQGRVPITPGEYYNINIDAVKAGLKNRGAIDVDIEKAGRYIQQKKDSSIKDQDSFVSGLVNSIGLSSAFDSKFIKTIGLNQKGSGRGNREYLNFRVDKAYKGDIIRSNSNLAKIGKTVNLEPNSIGLSRMVIGEDRGQLKLDPTKHSNVIESTKISNASGSVKSKVFTQIQEINKAQTGNKKKVLDVAGNEIEGGLNSIVNESTPKYLGKLNRKNNKYTPNVSDTDIIDVNHLVSKNGRKDLIGSVFTDETTIINQLNTSDGWTSLISSNKIIADRIRRVLLKNSDEISGINFGSFIKLLDELNPAPLSKWKKHFDDARAKELNKKQFDGDSMLDEIGDPTGEIRFEKATVLNVQQAADLETDVMKYINSQEHKIRTQSKYKPEIDGNINLSKELNNELNELFELGNQYSGAIKFGLENAIDKSKKLRDKIREIETKLLNVADDLTDSEVLSGKAAGIIKGKEAKAVNQLIQPYRVERVKGFKESEGSKFRDYEDATAEMDALSTGEVTYTDHRIDAKSRSYPKGSVVNEQANKQYRNWKVPANKVAYGPNALESKAGEVLNADPIFYKNNKGETIKGRSGIEQLEESIGSDLQTNLNGTASDTAKLHPEAQIASFAANKANITKWSTNPVKYADEWRPLVNDAEKEQLFIQKLNAYDNYKNNRTGEMLIQPLDAEQSGGGITTAMLADEVNAIDYALKAGSLKKKSIRLDKYYKVIQGTKGTPEQYKAILKVLQTSTNPETITAGMNDLSKLVNQKDIIRKIVYQFNNLNDLKKKVNRKLASEMETSMLEDLLVNIPQLRKGLAEAGTKDIDGVIKHIKNWKEISKKVLTDPKYIKRERKLAKRSTMIAYYGSGMKTMQRNIFADNKNALSDLTQETANYIGKKIYNIVPKELKSVTILDSVMGNLADQIAGPGILNDSGFTKWFNKGVLANINNIPFVLKKTELGNTINVGSFKIDKSRASYKMVERELKKYVGQGTISNKQSVALASLFIHYNDAQIMHLTKLKLQSLYGKDFADGIFPFRAAHDSLGVPIQYMDRTKEVIDDVMINLYRLDGQGINTNKGENFLHLFIRETLTNAGKDEAQIAKFLTDNKLVGQNSVLGTYDIVKELPQGNSYSK